MKGPLPLGNNFSLHQSASRVEQEKKLKSAAEMYERHFLNEIFKAMRKTVPESEGILQKGFAQKLYQDQLDERYVEAWGQQGGIGLSQLIFDQLKEKVLGDSTQLPPPKGPLPLSKSVRPLNSTGEMPTSLSPEASYLFVPEKKRPEEGLVHARQVTSPWEGRVRQSFSTLEKSRLIRIAHPEGVESILNYKSQDEGPQVGEYLQAGERLGVMDVGPENLVWSVTKSGPSGLKLAKA